MVIISSIGKIHAFDLAEQLEKKRLLTKLFTSYASQKDSIVKNFISRNDREIINANRIATNFAIAVGKKLQSNSNAFDLLFDSWVAGKIYRYHQAKVFIGWSGNSLKSMRAAKKCGMVTILSRGSSHILYQQEILKEEYKEYGIKELSISESNIETELNEYQEADYIAVPSQWAKNSFVERGIPDHKLFVNALGVSKYFNPTPSRKQNGKFRILYLGILSARKGLLYLFQALAKLDLPENDYEVWFIGKVSNEIKSLIPSFNSANWKFIGHIDHYFLGDKINQCDIAVLPSIEDGFGKVVVQCLACGVPVIVSENTGAKEVIQGNENGFVVPIRNADAIKEKIESMYNNREQLDLMKINARENVMKEYTWDQYGERYAEFLDSII